MLGMPIAHPDTQGVASASPLSSPVESMLPRRAHRRKHAWNPDATDAPLPPRYTRLAKRRYLTRYALRLQISLLDRLPGRGLIGLQLSRSLRGAGQLTPSGFAFSCHQLGRTGPRAAFRPMVTAEPDDVVLSTADMVARHSPGP